MNFLRPSWHLLRQTFSKASEDRTSRLAASLAYYAVFCIAPLVVITLRFAGYLFGEQAARHQLESQLRGLMGRGAAGAVLTLVGKASEGATGGFWPTLFSVALFVYAALVLFDELQSSMNSLWNVKRRTRNSRWSVVRNQVVSFAVVVATMVLFLISLAVATALPALDHSLHPGSLLGRPLEVVISVVVFTLIFANAYRFLPDAGVAWRDVWIAAAGAGTLFTLGKYLLGSYLAHSSGQSVYGVTGSVAVVLVWVYYSARVFFFWAEFAQVYGRFRLAEGPTSSGRCSTAAH